MDARARYYGLHATLKPPFRLIAGAAPSDVDRAAAALAAQHRAFAIELECAPLRGFLAWRLTGNDPAGRARIHALADAAVRELDPLRARPRPRNWPSACAIRWRRPSTRCWSAGATLCVRPVHLPHHPERKTGGRRAAPGAGLHRPLRRSARRPAHARRRRQRLRAARPGEDFLPRAITVSTAAARMRPARPICGERRRHERRAPDL